MSNPLTRPVLAGLAALLACASSTAHAGVPLVARVWIEGRNVTFTTAEFCAGGRVDDPPAVAGVWVLRVSGLRSNATVVTAAAPVGSGASFEDCLTVSSSGGVDAYAATLNFIGAGGDVTAVCTIPAVTLPAWQPLARFCLDNDPMHDAA